MKQNKKLIRNCWIILLVLWVMYYFGGFYLSEDKCIADVLKAYYIKDEEEIMSFQCGMVTYHLYSYGEDQNCIVSIGKNGFLHQKQNFLNDDYVKMIKERSQKEGFEYMKCSSADVGTMVYVYRDNKDIYSIHVELQNGMSTVLEEWKEDFSGFSIEHERMPNGDYVGVTFKAYDKEGNLIGERAY